MAAVSANMLRRKKGVFLVFLTTLVFFFIFVRWFTGNNLGPIVIPGPTRPPATQATIPDPTRPPTTQTTIPGPTRPPTTQATIPDPTRPPTTQATIPDPTRPPATRATRIPIHVCGNSTDFINVEDFIPSYKRERVDLFVAILSAPRHIERRMAIRQTYGSTINRFPIALRFFLDGIDLETATAKTLLQERDKFKDLELLPTRGGYWFSHRFLHAVFWAIKNYDFQFFLRVDDDYFVCLNNLHNDLKYRKSESLLYWGNMECDPKMVAMDEGFVILGVDLLRELLRRNNSMCCHPFGGQMIAMWMNRLESEGYDVTYFADNDRTVHYRKDLKLHPHLCRDLLGIHQAYPEYMKEYWNLTRHSWFNKTYSFRKVERKEFRDYCQQPKEWDWRVLSEFYRHEPKFCWTPGLEWPRLRKYKFHGGREVNP